MKNEEQKTAELRRLLINAMYDIKNLNSFDEDYDIELFNILKGVYVSGVSDFKRDLEDSSIHAITRIA